MKYKKVIMHLRFGDKFHRFESDFLDENHLTGLEGTPKIISVPGLRVDIRETYNLLIPKEDGKNFIFQES